MRYYTITFFPTFGITGFSHPSSPTKVTISKHKYFEILFVRVLYKLGTANSRVFDSVE